MNMKLWEIDDAIRSCVDFETGEIIDPVYLDQLEMIREQKIEGVALYCKELDYLAGEIAKEIETLTARKKAAENAVKGMKAWLAEACNSKKFETPKCKVSFRVNDSTIIDNEDAVPMEFKTRLLIPSARRILKRRLNLAPLFRVLIFRAASAPSLNRLRFNLTHLKGE